MSAVAPPARANAALTVARAAASVTLIGAIVSPPLAGAASAVMLLAFLFVPDARTRFVRALRSPLGLGVAALASALVAAALLGVFGPQGARAALAELLGWRTLLLLLIAAAIFDDDSARRRTLFAFAAVAAVAAAAVTLSAHLQWSLRNMPPGVLLRNTATQAIAFALGACFCAFLLLRERGSLRRWQRYALAGMLALLLWRLLFHEIGRSGHVLLAVAALVGAALELRGAARAAAVAAVPLAAALLLAASPVMRDRFALAAQEVANVAQARELTSMGVRVVMWQNAVELVRAQPLLGYGLGGTAPAYAKRVQDHAGDWRGTPTGDVHNQYLMLWLEAGLSGVLAFGALLIGAWRQPAPAPWRALGLAILAGWCVNSLFSSHFATFSEGHLIALLLGILLAPAPREHSRAD